jgi:hypothetical protein
MTLESATQAVLDALASADLEALARAIEVRSAIIEAGITPSAEVMEMGQRACWALEALKQRWAMESARLSQVRAGFGRLPDETGARLDWRG